MTWVASQPSARNPVDDPTGRFCTAGQTGEVWFVAGSFGETVTRSCTVPAGRPIAGPMVNRWGAEPDGCAEFLGSAKGEVLFDGEAVPLRTLDIEPVAVKGVAGNLLTGRAGVARTTACGIWFRIPAPSPGTHTLAIRGSSGTFSLDVRYTLTVAG